MKLNPDNVVGIAVLKQLALEIERSRKHKLKEKTTRLQEVRDS